MDSNSSVNKYSEFFTYDSGVTEEVVKNSDNRKKNDDNPNRLKVKEGLKYYMVLMPYPHGPKGVPPVINVVTHFRVGGRSFPCLYKNGLDDKCAADALVRKLWDEYKSYKEHNDTKKVAAVLAVINATQAKDRYWSPVWILNVKNKEDEPVIEEEDKWKGRVVWMQYPQGIRNQIYDAYKEYGALHNPLDPILIKYYTAKEKKEDSRKTSYPVPNIFFKQSRNKGEYAIVGKNGPISSEKELIAVLDGIPDIYKAGLFEVLSNDEIKKLIVANYGSDGLPKSKNRNNDLDSQPDDGDDKNELPPSVVDEVFAEDTRAKEEPVSTPAPSGANKLPDKSSVSSTDTYESELSDIFKDM